jgi:hypothetical protein
MAFLSSIFGLSSGPGSFTDILRRSQERKKQTETRLRFYHDRQTDELYRIIAANFDRPEDFAPLSCINIVRKIVRLQAVVYSGVPLRYFQGWDQAKGDALYNAAMTDAVLKKANRMVKLCKTAVLQVRWDETRERVALHVLTPNILDADFSDPNYPTRMIVTHPGADRPEQTEYSDWTETTFTRRDYRGFEIALPDNAERVNPYGVLPFVPLFDEWTDDEFFLPGGQDLIEAQNWVNVTLANLGRALSYQSNGQPVATGLDKAQNFKLGPNYTVTLPKDADFKFASPNAPIAEVLRAIEFKVKNTAIANNVASSVFEMNSKAESGSAKFAERIDLIEARRDDLSLWRIYEARLFEIIKRVVNTHRPGTIPETATLKVDYAEIDRALTQLERMQTNQFRLDLGIASPVDLYLEENEDVHNRQDALKRLQEIREENELLGRTFTGPRFDIGQNQPGVNPAEQPGNEPAEDESASATA